MRGACYSLVLLACLLTGKTFSQVNHGNIPSTIPTFNILLQDGITYFNSGNLSSGKKLMIVYFDPDCDHCKTFAKALVPQIKAFNETQIVFICSSNSLPLIKSFSSSTQLNKYPAVKIGTEGIYHATMNFYKVETTPFIALYAKSGQLIKYFRNAPPVKELISLLHQ